MEVDYFITEYLNSTGPEMGCVLKHFYSDFIVKEISENGTLCEVCTSPSAEVKEFEGAKKSADVVDPDFPTPEIVSDENVAELDELLTEKDKAVTLPTEGLSKEERTKIHVWVRHRYKGILQSQTKNGAIVISNIKNDRQKRKQWPSDRPDYLHFTLSKENKDSQYALSLIAKFLGTKVTNLGTRGTKDRRAITAQRVSLYRYDASRVKELNSRLRGIRLSDFTYENKPCLLGDLWGNRFEVVLRNVSLAEDEIEKRLKKFSELGFINYFGTQRFGSCGVSTAQIGLAIIRKQWKKAVQTILGPRDVKGCLGDALQVWQETQDPKLALQKLSGGQAYASIESQLLKTLSNGDQRSALMSLPRSSRSLYVHAYQSLIWNKVASERIKKYGTKVLQGDIDCSGSELKEDSELSNVALPLPSSEMMLPKNTTAEFYKKFLQEDNVDAEMFSSLERDFAVANVLRPLIVKPKDIDYEVLQYSNVDSKLQPDLNGELDIKDRNGGEHKALIIRFSLPAGSYATVALREITRCDMGKLSQSLSSAAGSA